MSAGEHASSRTEAPIHGSPTCEDVRYLSVVRGALAVSADVVKILRALRRAGLPIDVDHAAISHLLHDGFVPQPRAVYRDVFAISVDLSATRIGQSVVFSRNFPYTNAKSRQDERPSTRRLVSLLAKSVEAACCAAGRRKMPSCLLMVSLWHNHWFEGRMREAIELADGTQMQRHVR